MNFQPYDLNSNPYTQNLNRMLFALNPEPETPSLNPLNLKAL
jgi:hypothetical protein